MEKNRPQAKRLVPPGLGVGEQEEDLAVNSKDIRVVLVDDHQMFLMGVGSELADHLDIVGTASNVKSAVEIIYAEQPDVVLLDVHMPDGGGQAVLNKIIDSNIQSQKGEPIQFLALSVSDDPTDVVSLVRAGARGYLTKSASREELIEAVVRVYAKDAVFSPRLAGFVLDAFAGISEVPAKEELLEDPDYDTLTPREREVLQLIARGYAYKQVAARLEISVKTVESHVSSVLRKLQLSSRYELTRWASDRHII